MRASCNDEAETPVAHFIAKGAKSIAVFYQDDGLGQAVLSGTEKAPTKRASVGQARAIAVFRLSDAELSAPA